MYMKYGNVCIKSANKFAKIWLDIDADQSIKQRYTQESGILCCPVSLIQVQSGEAPQRYAAEIAGAKKADAGSLPHLLL